MNKNHSLPILNSVFLTIILYYIITIWKYFLEKPSQNPLRHPSRSSHLLKSKLFVNFLIFPWQCPSDLHVILYFQAHQSLADPHLPQGSILGTFPSIYLFAPLPAVTPHSASYFFWLSQAYIFRSPVLRLHWKKYWPERLHSWSLFLLDFWTTEWF